MSRIANCFWSKSQTTNTCNTCNLDFTFFLDWLPKLNNFWERAENQFFSDTFQKRKCSCGAVHAESYDLEVWSIGITGREKRHQVCRQGSVPPVWDKSPVVNPWYVSYLCESPLSTTAIKHHHHWHYHHMHIIHVNITFKLWLGHLMRRECINIHPCIVLWCDPVFRHCNIECRRS